VAAVRPTRRHEDFAPLVGLHRRPQRVCPRQRDRRRRQSCPRVGIVRPVALEVRAAQVAVVRCADPVDHRGVGLQAHAAPQPFGEHAGDAGPLGRQGGFLFDDRRQDQRLVRILERQVPGTGGPCALEFLAHARARLSKDLEVGRALHKNVRIREEHALGMLSGSSSAHHRGITLTRQCLPEMWLARECCAGLAEGQPR
jgi:hypothetical protein